MNKMEKDKWLPEIETHIQVGAEIPAGERRIYPILKVLVIFAGDSLAGIKIDPLALLIVEPGIQYGLSMQGEHMQLDEIYKLAPSLKEIAEDCFRVISASREYEPPPEG